MKRFGILFITVLLVLAGAFLPELMLTNDRPEGILPSRQVSITTESSSDYAWRMERISEHSFGEGLLATYIASAGPAEETRSQFLDALALLTGQGVLPQAVLELAESCEDQRVSYYYLFDTDTISGFRIAEFSASGANWQVSACMDVESGKLARVEYGGSRLIPGGQAVPETSWYDILRSYGNYLGLEQTPIPLPEQSEANDGERNARQYYDNCTAERWASGLSGGTGWMELRALRESYRLTLTVYNGGR